MLSIFPTTYLFPKVKANLKYMQTLSIERYIMNAYTN